jgi:hypothetical protein
MHWGPIRTPAPILVKHFAKANLPAGTIHSPSSEQRVYTIQYLEGFALAHSPNGLMSMFDMSNL